MRAEWSFTKLDRWGWDDGQIEVTVADDHVLIEITQEKAMDSYNQEFTCSVTLPLEKVAELAQLLASAVQAAQPTT